MPKENTGRLTMIPEVRPDEIESWKMLVKQLPAVRTEKVQTARMALKKHDFDNDRRVDETVSRIVEEITRAFD